MAVSIEAIWAALSLCTITGLIWSVFEHQLKPPTSKWVKR